MTVYCVVEWSPYESTTPELHGCYLDRNEALEKKRELEAEVSRRYATSEFVVIASRVIGLRMVEP